MSDAVTINQTAIVRIMREDGDIGFEGLAAVYKFDTGSDQIRDVLATSLRTGREVNFVNDRRCHIHAAELAPIQPTILGQFIHKIRSACSRHTVK